MISEAEKFEREIEAITEKQAKGMTEEQAARFEEQEQKAFDMIYNETEEEKHTIYVVGPYMRRK